MSYSIVVHPKIEGVSPYCVSRSAIQLKVSPEFLNKAEIGPLWSNRVHGKHFKLDAKTENLDGLKKLFTLSVLVLRGFVHGLDNVRNLQFHPSTQADRFGDHLTLASIGTSI